MFYLNCNCRKAAVQKQVEEDLESRLVAEKLLLEKASAELEVALQRESAKLVLAVEAEKSLGKAAVERCQEEISAIKCERDNARQELLNLEKQ